MRSRTRRASEVLAAYRTAFGGLTEEQRSLLDGVDRPFLFDTSAESWLERNADQVLVQEWLDSYLARHEMHVSAITVLERVRGYARLGRRTE